MSILYCDLPSSNSLALPAALNQPLCAAVSYRTAHKNLQPVQPANFPTSDPNDPSWSWGFFDSCIAQANQYNKPFFLRVFFQSGNSPTWMEPLAQQYVDVAGNEYNVWWDSNFQAAVTAVIQAIAARYGANPLFKYCSFNIVTQSSGDWSMPHATNGNFTMAGSANCPAYGNIVALPVSAKSGHVGNICYIPNFGWFQITQTTAANTKVQNLGISGNASSGVIPSGTVVQINDIQNLRGPVYNYTTAKLVNAQVAVDQAVHAALPNVVIDQEVGRNGNSDPYPPGSPTHQYNASTQVAQQCYATIPLGRFCVGKNTLQPYNDTPASALSKKDSSDIYLPAQCTPGSTNTSGTTGVIPQNSLLFFQFLWQVYDPTGAYSPESTASALGPYGATGGVPYGADDIYDIFNGVVSLALQYGAALLEIYEQDMIHLAQPPPTPGPAALGLLVSPYTGQSQASTIQIPAPTAYQGWDGEEGPWVMPPYAQIFGYDSQADAQTQAWVPPPTKQTDIWSAQQTFPL